MAEQLGPRHRQDRRLRCMARNRKDTPVVLSRIYTRTGDGGRTRLGDMSEVAKTDPRLAAYADVDEANCAIGTAIALGRLDRGVVVLLTRIQNELFDVGADLCKPVTQAGEDDGGEPGGTGASRSDLRITDDYITGLEAGCDRYNEDLPVLRSFVLPGGTPGAALLHVARAVTRRAERSAWTALGALGDSVNPLTARYLNRLSDLLFILARHANIQRGDVLWKPGGER
jgi:cob(I)alamin adenosyltransferase